MNSLYDSTKKIDARKRIENTFDKIIKEYELQEKQFIETFLNPLISIAHAENGIEDLLKEVKKNFPEYFYYTTHGGYNIELEANSAMERYRMGDDDYDIGDIEDEKQAYGLIYEKVIKDMFESMKNNILQFGPSLLRDPLLDLDFMYNLEYKSLVQAVNKIDIPYLTINHIGTDNRHGDFSLSIDGNIEGLMDTKSMKLANLTDINEIYRNILKNVPINNNKSSYKSYIQGLVDSFKYNTKKELKNRQNNVLIFMFRDEAIWTSELLKRLKDDVINDWMNKYDNGRLIFK